MGGGRLFVHTSSNPYALVTPITRMLRTMSADQPVEHAATLDDIRAEVLSPDRLNVVVFGVFAGCCAVDCRRWRRRCACIFSERAHARVRHTAGGRVAAAAFVDSRDRRRRGHGGRGTCCGAACGFGLARLAGSFLGDLKIPGIGPVAGSALVLLFAAVIASVVPAARAARVDVMQALRSD